MPCSFREWPSITRVAILAIGMPVLLEMKGTVREDLGLTSITYTFSSLSTMNWMLNRPTMPMALPSFTVSSMISCLTLGLRLKEG